MEVRLKINIDQNVPALVTSNANYEVTTYGAKIAHNCFSGIGTYPKYVHGCEIYLMPSGLTIKPFIERGEDDKLEQFTKDSRPILVLPLGRLVTATLEQYAKPSSPPFRSG